MMKFVIATTNPGKVAEISALLNTLERNNTTQNTAIELLSLADFPGMPEIVEDGSTFIDNALKKARETAWYTGCATLADDSGIVVDALGGEPGVHSARFADTNDEDYQKILAMCEAGERRLNEIKRFDMPGFVPRRGYIREMKKYEILPESHDENAPVDPYALDQAYWKSLWHVKE